MSITTTGYKIEYTGNGSLTGPYPFPYWMLSTASMVVVVDGVVQSSGYTTTGSGSSWNVNFTTAPVNGAAIILRRSTANTQETDYVDQSAFPANNFEDDLDKRTAISQEVSGDDSFSLRYSENESGITVLDTDLPTRTLRANTSLGFDANGNLSLGAITSNATSAVLVAESVATAGQTAITVATHTTGINLVSIYINGAKLLSSDYVETSGTVVTLNEALFVGDTIRAEVHEVQDVTNSAAAGSVTFTQSGTGALSSNVQAKLEQYVSVKDFGASTAGTAAANSTAIQAAINYCETVAASGNSITLTQDGDMLFDSTLTVQVSAPTGGRSVNLDFRGRLHYTGVDTQPAIVIGETAKILSNTFINLELVNDNQSDWTEAAGVGIRIFNAHVCEIHIRKSTGFTVGVECVGSGSGFVHNNVFLLDIINNKYGVDLKPESSGWVNENTFYGGKFFVNTGVNATIARYGVRLGRTGEFICNNNVFYHPSTELNSTDTGAGLTFGYAFENAAMNHILQPRSEITETIAVFDVDCYSNEVIMGREDAASNGVTDGGKAGNVVICSKRISEHRSKIIFDIPDLKSRAAPRSSGVSTIAGLLGANTTTGALTHYGPALIIGPEDITITSGSYAYGVIVDTRDQKQFILGNGFTGNGGRLFTICYNALDVELTGTSPAYAIGASGNDLTVVGTGYLSGADTTANQSVRFHDDVKRAFIGVRKGTANAQFNSFRLMSVDDVKYVAKPAILSKTPTYTLSPDFRWGDQAPTIGTWKASDAIWDITPSAGGKMGWVCVTAGTQGTLNGGATTGGITSGLTALVVSSATDLLVGQSISIAGVTGTKVITAISGLNVTINSTADATVVGAAVAWVNATWKTFGAITA